MELYLKNKNNIQHVKQFLMPFAQGVEEARFYVQQAMKNGQEETKIGDELDGELENELLECQDEEEVIHPDFAHLNPDELEIGKDIMQTKKTIRNIETRTLDQILEEARQLDQFQKEVLNLGIKYAQNIRIARKGKRTYPNAPWLIGHGGAGAGKSTVIDVLSQYIQHILRKDGDDPDCPYVLLSAFTGSAASKINGQTLHNLFSFNFGAGYMSLSDKLRDQKRALFKNIKVLIIDEFSLVDADMLYKIDLRLREITQKAMPFGNIAIFLFGDIMQMKPVKGRYIMQHPRNEQFDLSCQLDPLWQKFECINLEINHRQGEDKEYADMLNRIRIGQETAVDVEKLRERVRIINHPDIRREHDALYIFGTNKKVNQMNNLRLKKLKGEEKLATAICIHRTIKKFNPPVSNAGTVATTPFQKELRLKIGAKVR